MKNLSDSDNSIIGADKSMKKENKTVKSFNNMQNAGTFGVLERDFQECNIQSHQSIYNRHIKHVLDVIFAVFCFIILLPVYLVISVAIVIETGFPILYRAERGGYRNKPFQIFKFRSMIQNAEKTGGGTTSLNDSRITKIGNILRKTKLDETPQLINIIKGEMSFVGPRPELLKYTQQYQRKEKLILEVRPGITDYSSIEFINLDEIVGKDNADEMYEKHVLKKKNQLRIKYAATVSFRTDAKLLFLTVYKVMKKALGFLIKKEHRG